MPMLGDIDFNPHPCDTQECVNKENRESKKDELVFVERVPGWTINEIILDEKTKSQLNEVVVYLNEKETIVEEWNLKRFLKCGGGCTCVNMYGKPGTGKTIAAEAIAKDAHLKIIKVDYSEIQSEKWGGTERQLTALFKQAKKTGSVIFFDEADALLSKRQSVGANSETNNQIKSHLITLMDNYDVLVFFATNLFENYDRAFFRRILFHIPFPLPTESELVKLWEFHLGSDLEPKKVPRAKDFSFVKLAEDSIGLSGGDIKNLTLRACIHLKAKNEKELTNDLMIKEIEMYKKSLADSEKAPQGFELNGEQAKKAEKMFDNQ